jgi:3(or 17)beta-hydroxysteroid dehydrogenase
MGRVTRKIALVTGASSGIGRASAELLSQEGAFVIITDILDKEGQDLAKKINGEYHHLDVSLESEWQDLYIKLKNTHGRIDILFNNAGITGLNENLGPLDPENISLEAWHHVHKINLDGIFLGCKYAIKLMKNHGGSIINMSSRSAVVGVPSICAYASSKAAIKNHTKSVALYCAQQGYNIRCNSVQPGAILTKIWDPMLASDKLSKQEMLTNLERQIPVGHMGYPIDVAYAVLYLGSDESKYITGTELNIDGGILAGSAASPEKK